MASGVSCKCNIQALILSQLQYIYLERCRLDYLRQNQKNYQDRDRFHCSTCRVNNNEILGFSRFKFWINSQGVIAGLTDLDP